MNTIENFKSAIFNILSSKMRTFLTTLGIIIGIMSVIIITAIGKGFKNDITNTFSSIDTGVVSIGISNNDIIKDKDKFTLKDLDSIRTLKNIKFVSPTYNTNVTVKLKNPDEIKSASLSGINEDGKDLKKLKMKYGRFLDAKDRQGKSKVCIIDNNLAKSIFGRENVIGESISSETISGNIKNIELEVIGVYEVENTPFYTPVIYYPIETAMDFLGNSQQLFQSISAKFENETLFEQTKRQILKTLSANHNNDEDKYTVDGNFAVLNTMEDTIKVFTIFISIVAGISLLVGGIGVMNIMLVTVTERTREIGIRKSLGATNGNIKMQFLIEAVTVALLGGIVGIIFGYIGSFVAGKVISNMGSNIKPEVALPVVIGAMVISSIIGVVFGVYPAGKAAKLDPIEALRYE